MNDIMKKRFKESLKNELGITHDEFELLNYYQQRRLIELKRKKKKTNSKHVNVMIGSGEHEIFVKKRRGDGIMLEDGSFIIAGDIPDESRKKIDDRIDDIVYTKPVTFVKKMLRR